MADGYCSDCKTYTHVVYDHTAGDTICSECGLVLESHSVDETAEWRNFSDESHTHDPVRVGGRSNPLLPNDTVLDTVIANPTTTAKITNSCNGSSSSASNFIKQLQSKNHELRKETTPLLRACRTIDQMAENLGLVETIKNYAKELYKKVDDERICGRWRNSKAIMGACLYLACQQEGFPRTFKEINSVAVGAKLKDIHKAVEALKNKLEVGNKTIQAKDIARRYCSNLGLSNNTVKAVQETVQKTEGFDIRRNSTSILAAAIYMVTQLSEENKLNLREVAQASEVAETTLRKAYKDLYPLASLLIPSWYATPQDIKRLNSL